MTNTPVLDAMTDADMDKLNASPETLAELEAIPDPIARFATASQIAARVYRRTPEMDELYNRRRIAFGLLHLKYEMSKAEIGRQADVADRRVINRALDKVDERHLPGRAIRKGQRVWLNKSPEEQAAALEEARTVHAEIVKNEAIGTTAREMRRILGLNIQTGVYGARMTPTELAAQAGVSTAAWSQLMNGTANSWNKTVGRERRRNRQSASSDS
ncbi:hypothetical protein ACFY05_32320 [Microtetraspora fusca]|uniref:Helix-turn-helix transcriptional regulator n=1 Tax=Microtetraspora fusca TaxID=1997 RepID=A0ABW6VEX9_MICFU